MSSETARRAAGTYVVDSIRQLRATTAWATQECRTGSLASAVRQFCDGQPEPLDPQLVLVESITSSLLSCRIPCKISDCESPSTFDFEVGFTLDPATGDCRRI